MQDLSSVCVVLTWGALWYGKGNVGACYVRSGTIVQGECWGDCSHLQQRKGRSTSA